MTPKRKTKKGLRINGKIYSDGECIGRINDANIDEFEAQVKMLRKKLR